MWSINNISYKHRNFPKDYSPNKLRGNINIHLIIFNIIPATEQFYKKKIIYLLILLVTDNFKFPDSFITTVTEAIAQGILKFFSKEMINNMKCFICFWADNKAKKIEHTLKIPVSVQLKRNISRGMQVYGLSYQCYSWNIAEGLSFFAWRMLWMKSYIPFIVKLNM